MCSTGVYKNEKRASPINTWEKKKRQ